MKIVFNFGLVHINYWQVYFLSSSHVFSTMHVMTFHAVGRLNVEHQIPSRPSEHAWTDMLRKGCCYSTHFMCADFIAYTFLC